MIGVAGTANGNSNVVTITKSTCGNISLNAGSGAGTAGTMGSAVISNSTVGSISNTTGNNGLYLKMAFGRYISIANTSGFSTLYDYCLDGNAATSNKFTGKGTSVNSIITSNQVIPSGMA